HACLDTEGSQKRMPDIWHDVAVATLDTNLRVLRPSRKAPLPGDVFAVQVPDSSYRFGRVIRDDATWTLAEGAGPAVLVYIYTVRANELAVPSREELRPGGLLLPPMMTNRLPWTRGYFATVDHLPLDEADVLAPHCFFSASRGIHFDADGHMLQSPSQPVGDFGLHSFRTIDDAISDALSIPRANT
ncbi:immunity 26/phosphotriesterase HocA family protein, partial [Nocardioides sp.]|uniref:immunity 26/phosphotriesterase HocA family protein n=2 Tax=Nocardioides sp. TaxID=35761 RepID=UPI0035155147